MEKQEKGANVKKAKTVRFLVVLCLLNNKYLFKNLCNPLFLCHKEIIEYGMSKSSCFAFL